MSLTVTLTRATLNNAKRNRIMGLWAEPHVVQGNGCTFMTSKKVYDHMESWLGPIIISFCHITNLRTLNMVTNFQVDRMFGS